MDNYVPNSHRYKEEQKRTSDEKREIRKVAGGKVRTKKKSELSKLSDVFISEDAANVKNYIFFDVLVPAIKNAIIDIATDSVNMIFGGTRRSSNGSLLNLARSNSYVSYNKYSDRRDTRSSYEDSRSRARFDYDDIIYESRAQAMDALDTMEDAIDAYGFVTVADMYDMVDLTAPYTGNRYGWYSLRDAEVTRLRGGGYIIKLPKAEVIKK